MRTIELALDQFPTIPNTLLDAGGGVLKSLEVPLMDLFRHYWAAKYGDDLPKSSSFEYLSQITSGTDWRTKGRGIGSDTESKRNISNELGKAFARWFMYTHVGYTYFCPFSDAITRSKDGGPRWSRRTKGDLPDYVCGIDSRRGISLLEAKGRYSSVTFATKEFESFREQLGRACLHDANGVELAVKGFICAARWGTESQPRVNSKLWVEDPWTEGRRTDSYPEEIGVSMVLGHYAAVYQKLQLPVIADSLRFAFPLRAAAARQRRGIWRCNAGPLAGREFVGGIIPPTGVIDGRFIIRNYWDVDPFVLSPPLQFFGIERKRFHIIVRAAAFQGNTVELDLDDIYIPENLGAISLLRDGTVLAPADYFDRTGIVDVDELI
ncbi:hypothetical protein [Janthinobacterium lividum]|uniref:hypothetical protein n=1 Tax=Janthinobacterium lividum TaxID=29581 RepID=UPI0008740785|nr:hypothetical protein [Janthinobacterium lividum]MCC7716916.1 hypothetical protein [Janthinobacterium lividum]OEZ62302.1 hypothetical protein JANLI_10060 [Janthinobacterium lividum]WQE31865.1 hypothetical protein U0004_28575 [Janthinobacterium lividum]